MEQGCRERGGGFNRFKSFPVKPADKGEEKSNCSPMRHSSRYNNFTKVNSWEINYLKSSPLKI